MSDIYTVIKLIGRILSVALIFALVIVCDCKIWVWFDDNRTRRAIWGGWQKATYPWVDWAYRIWIFLHVAVIGGFFIVCWFVL